MSKKDAVAEVHDWRQRIDTEIKSQLQYASDWGSILVNNKPPADIDEAIERVEKELKE